MPNYIKQRSPAKTGSIAAALNMFESEVRFYREIAPVIGVRVPACYRAESNADGSTLLEIEDLSAWRQGAEPAAAAELLRSMHDRWTGRADVRWPWLRSIGTGEELVARLYDETWPKLAARSLSAPVHEFGERMVGKVQQAEAQLLDAGPLTLVHGDASGPNLRTSPDGEIVLLDWEDVSAAPGVLDLAWHLISSVEPSRWAETLAAYGPAEGLIEVLPSTMVQGYLSMSDWPADSEEAAGFEARLAAGAAML